MADAAENQVEETTVLTDEAATEAPESISLADLSLLANIVDLASQRGAFRGNELTQVGTVFDKLTAFLGYIAAQQEAAAEGEAEAAAEE